MRSKLESLGRGGEPEASPPQEKVQGDHSPAGAAEAAAVPEVPDGAPKLKAMSREQGTPKRCSRDSRCTQPFNPAGKPAPAHCVPLLLGRSNRPERPRGVEGGGWRGNAPFQLAAGCCVAKRARSVTTAGRCGKALGGVPPEMPRKLLCGTPSERCTGG